MQATNTILDGYTVNSFGFFPTSWKQAGHGNTNPDSTHLSALGTIGGSRSSASGNMDTVNMFIHQ